MINEERVKELYKVALYDKNEDSLCSPISKYYRKDYIRKELLKSIFSGTIVYALVIALILMNQADMLFAQMNSLDMVAVALISGLVYVAFLAIYLLITYLVFQIRYTYCSKRTKAYAAHLKKLEKMYAREEK